MRERLATVFAKRDDPYAGADLALASRFGGALYFLGALFTAVILPFVPPDDAIGNAGWIVAAGAIVGCLVIGLRMRHMGAQANVDVGDLDEFKDFNDRFGHLEGDSVLKDVAGALERAVRRPDAAYRWGGDEFAVILPQADPPGAELVGWRIQAAVGELSGPDGEPLRITTGAAAFDHEDGRGVALVDAADRALLLAKGSGAFDTPQPQG